jgi:type II secretory pathway component PulM
VRNKVIIGILLLIAVFLVSFFPQFLKARRLETELREARQQYAVAQLRDVIGLAYFQATQKNYGREDTTATAGAAEDQRRKGMEFHFRNSWRWRWKRHA